MKSCFRLLALGLIFGLLGCGGGIGPRSTVKGKITVGGKGPLTGGNIQFIPTEGQYGSGIISADGTYTVADAPVGECKVVIDNTNLAGPTGGMPGPKMGKKDNAKMSTAPAKATIPTEMNAGKGGNTKYIKIEASYTRAESTTLKATLSRGENTVDFDVK